MLESIKNFLFNNELSNGLLLLDSNTGSGKSYYSCQAIYDYVHSPNAKQVYFTTTLLKNLCIQEMENIYKKQNTFNFNKEVLIIKSNVNFVKDNLLKVTVPYEFQSSEYKKLIKLIEIVKTEGFNSKEEIYRKEIEKQLEEAEKAFRRSLRKIISNNIEGTLKEKKEILKHQKKYNWIPQIYPTVFTDEYKIIFLSISKLLKRNDTLLKPSYSFISTEVMQNSILFIDEFDATKETIKDDIIEEAVKSQNDYLDIVRELHGKLHDLKPSKNLYNPYEEYAKNNPKAQTLESMTKAVDSIFEDYSLVFNYKSDSKNIDHSRSFLFFDGSFRSYLRNNSHYIRTNVDSEAQQVKLHFESKEEYENNKNRETDIYIYSLLRDVSSFLYRFARFIAIWAEKYATTINFERKKSTVNGLYETFTFENAVNTICSIYFKNERLQEILRELVVSSRLKSKPSEKLQTNIDDFSFYNRGFRIFEFLDSDNHNEETKIQFVQINYTPEKIISFMASHTKIIGLSATCRINSVLSNYSLDYLKEKLEDKLFFLSEETYNSIKAEQKQKWAAYKDGRVNIVVESVDYEIENKLVDERLSLICNHSELQKIFHNKFSNLNLPKNNVDYYQKRYCNIFEVLKRFMENKEIKSFLCLNMALPKENESHLDLILINEFVEKYCEVHNAFRPEIRVLNSVNFDENKDLLLQELSEGKKIFVFSSYKTIGAGQNLQYKIPDNEDISNIYKRPGESKEEEKKDFDGIYLGDITNLITNIYDVAHIGLNELLEYLFEIKYLYSNYEISPTLLKAVIKTGFMAYSNKRDYKNSVEEIRFCASVRRKATRDVIQAVGRICRTFNKKKNIYIYTNNSLLTTIDNSCVRMDIINPELEAFFNYSKNFNTLLPTEKKLIENEASNKSIAADCYIKGILQRDWTFKSMNIWKELRETVLQYPTATKEDAEFNNTIKQFYIPNYENKSNYYYAQAENFKDIQVNIFEDYTVFKKKLDSDFTIMKVSEDSARLKLFFNYPGMEALFKKNNYATNFGNKDLIISPTLFNNIYKGALGEVAGRYILEKELNTKLSEIENPEYFEFFDFILADDIYIDFKHWKYTIEKGTDSLFKKIQGKLDTIGGKKIYIINILQGADNQKIVRDSTENYADRIIEIPWLIDDCGKPNEDVIKMLIGDSYER